MGVGQSHGEKDKGTGTGTGSQQRGANRRQRLQHGANPTKGNRKGTGGVEQGVNHGPEAATANPCLARAWGHPAPVRVWAEGWGLGWLGVILASPRWGWWLFPVWGGWDGGRDGAGGEVKSCPSSSFQHGIIPVPAPLCPFLPSFLQ